MSLLSWSGRALPGVSAPVVAMDAPAEACNKPDLMSC